MILFLNGLRGLIILKTLLENKSEIKSVVLSDDNETEIIEVVKSQNLNLIITENINNVDTVSKIKNFRPELFVLSGFRQILKKELLDVPLIGTINLHAGKLPEYRGGSPLNWQIINGENFAYLTTIFTDEGIDTGNILKEQKIEILDEDDIKSLHKKANKIFPKMLLESIKMVRENNFGKKQNEANASYWHQRSDADGYLDFQNNDAGKIVRIVKAITNARSGIFLGLNEYLFELNLNCIVG